MAVMSDDLPPQLAVQSAHRSIRRHATERCSQCRTERCWMLEWSLWVVVTCGQKLPDDLRFPVTLAARRIVNDHWPRAVDGCRPCGLPDCEPMGYAAEWLIAVGDHFMPAVARPVPSDDELHRITGL